jgi:nitroimidazol reductase NimA-like FMN-containing flavoprotein (pyridoxamine 5'-phosphate oxidase superfamily)
MFREMIRKDKMLSAEAAREILVQGEYGVLGMQGDYPYGIPVSYVYSENAVYIHCAEKGLKIELIKKCDRVCFTVTAEVRTIPEQFTVHYKSAVLFGKASFLEGEEKRRALLLLCGKYSAGFMDKANDEIEKYFDKTAVIKVCIEHLSGKQSKY